VVDTYGGYFPVGGGGLHGKDPTKVDLSGHLAARYAAKQLVKEGLCRKAEIEVVYTIGYPAPVAIRVDSYGTGILSDRLLEDRVREYIDFSVDGMIEALNLYSPVYTKAARSGFFGNKAFLWER
jgi:S-adenosylmethionine synthetase